MIFRKVSFIIWWGDTNKEEVRNWCSKKRVDLIYLNQYEEVVRELKNTYNKLNYALKVLKEIDTDLSRDTVEKLTQ